MILCIDLTFSLKSIYGTEISFVANRTSKKILAIVWKKILHIIQLTMLWIFCEIKMTIKLPSSISFISRLHVTWEVLSTPNVWFISRYFILSFKIPLVFLSCNLTCQFMVKKFIHDESFIINRAKICTYRHFIQWTGTILLQSTILVKWKNNFFLTHWVILTIISSFPTGRILFN